MKFWKRSLRVSAPLLATVAVTAGVLPFQGSASLAAASLVVRWEERSLPFNQTSPAPAAIVSQPSSATPTFSVAQNRSFTLEDFTVGQISLRSTEAQVREWLGTPESVEENRESLIGYERYLYYNRNGIHGVQLVQDPATGEFVVFSLLVKAPGTTTAVGIGVGDTAQKLLDTYGPPQSVWNQGERMDYWYYSSAELDASVQFTVVDGDRISEISVSRISPLRSDNLPAPHVLSGRSFHLTKPQPIQSSGKLERQVGQLAEPVGIGDISGSADATGGKLLSGKGFYLTKRELS